MEKGYPPRFFILQDSFSKEKDVYADALGIELKKCYVRIRFPDIEIAKRYRKFYT